MRRPPSDPLSLSIVLPCYREEDNVERVVREAVSVGRLVAADLEVLVVDDGSDDRTAEIALALARELPEVRVVSNGRNVGYGGALSLGFRSATKDWVFYTDGDGQFDIGELPEVLRLLESHDVVSAYRAERRDGLARSACGAGWTLLVDLLLDVRLRDVNCAFKVFPRALFDRIEMRSEGALIDAEVLSQARALGLRIAQVPVTHRPRAAGVQTGAQPRVIARAFRELLELVDRRAAPRLRAAGRVAGAGRT